MKTKDLIKVATGGLMFLALVMCSGLKALGQTPGDLDPTFGNGGIALGYSPGYQLYSAYAMAIQPDGKTVVVGEGVGPSHGANWEAAVVRFNPDGSLDTSLGGTGIVINPVGRGFYSVAIQRDGKIVAVSWVLPGTFGVVRYNPNGSLDNTFNGSGIVLTPVSDYGRPSSVAIQTDGKIVVGGNNGNDGFAIVRYNANGSLDNTFNGSGKVLTALGSAPSVAIQTDGKIIAAGGTGPNWSAFTLVRYNADGSLDTSFNGTGMVSTSVGSMGAVSDLALQTDGKIVVLGYNSFFSIVRYNPDGSLDSSFGGTGKILNPINVYAGSVAIQPNGKIVVGGISYVGALDNDSVFAVGRLNPDGSVDTSFNGTGIVITPVGKRYNSASYDSAGLVAIQADGKIVLAGDSGPDEFKSFVVIRYQGDAPCSSGNPIDCPEFFIRQQYSDFLGREPEPAGLNGWLNTLNNCGVTVAHPCDRIEVSSAFFRSPEFQGRGYFIYRFYPTIGKVPTHPEFMPDFAKVSGFLTDQQLEAAKAAFVLEFMSRAEFQNRYALTFSNPTAYVDALLQTVALPNHPARQSWINQLNGNNTTQTRADVLRALVESGEMDQKYFNEAFVVMQYFGYLRRTADAAYLDWIQTMNQNGGDYRIMINGFMNSIEYRQRFGP